MEYIHLDVDQLKVGSELYLDTADLFQKENNSVIFMASKTSDVCLKCLQWMYALNIH